MSDIIPSSLSQSGRVHYRKATLADIPRILQITKEVIVVLNAEGNYQWDSNYPLESDFLRDIEKDVLWVAVVDDQEVAGFAALTEDQPEEYQDAGMDISITTVVPHRVAVSLQHQGHGIATHFMSIAEELSRQRGYKCIRVDTNAKNTRMQRVFEKAGYTFAGEIMFKHKPELYGKMTFYCYSKSL